MIIVIPSNREINLNYLAPLIDSGVRFIVVDDSEGSINVNHSQFEVYNWGDRKKMLGPLDIGYPRKNGASRDFGFYVAWKNSEPEEIIVALDDDCEVYHQDFCSQVQSVLSFDEKPVVTTSGDHLNILNLYDKVSSNLYPRGFPYSARAEYKGIDIKSAQSRNVTFSLGLWKNIFDINGIDKIQGPEYCHPNASLKMPSVIIEEGKLISVCSMNMQFKRELIPAVYQLPMHVEVMSDWMVDRYGDIWGGFILKTLMDLKGEAMAVGEPMINHLKEGNYTRNIWQEHICHLVNDEFLDILFSIRDTIKSRDYLEMMKELNEGFKKHVEEASAILKPYLIHLSVAMDAWNTSLS